MHQAGHLFDSTVSRLSTWSAAQTPELDKLLRVVSPGYCGYRYGAVLFVRVAAGSMEQHGSASILVVVHGTSSTFEFPHAACIWADIGKLYLPDLSTTSFRAEVGFRAQLNVATDLAGLDLCIQGTTCRMHRVSGHLRLHLWVVNPYRSPRKTDLGDIEQASRYRDLLKAWVLYIGLDYGVHDEVCKIMRETNVEEYHCSVAHLPTGQSEIRNTIMALKNCNPLPLYSFAMYFRGGAKSYCHPSLGGVSTSTHEERTSQSS